VQTTVEAEQKTDRPLRVLIVEDAKSDVALLLLALRAGGFDVTHEAVATKLPCGQQCINGGTSSYPTMLCRSSAARPPWH
jgi:hypothetical protein